MFHSVKSLQVKIAEFQVYQRVKEILDCPYSRTRHTIAPSVFHENQKKKPVYEMEQHVPWAELVQTD